MATAVALGATAVASAEPITISAEDLTAEYAKSRREANTKYKHNDLVVFGYFKSTTGNSVFFQGGGSCLMNKSLQHTVADLEYGQYIVMGGVGFGHFFGDPSIYKCLLLGPEDLGYITEGSDPSLTNQSNDGPPATQGVATEDDEPQEAPASTTPEYWEASLVGVWSPGHGDGYLRFYEDGTIVLIADNCSLTGNGRWKYEYGALTFYDSTGQTEVSFFNIISVPVKPVPGDVLVLDTSREWMLISDDPDLEC
ncbi:MAG: hypothetical protein OXC31_00495 [Spirochaetaceae bacterium]|nr:hypothetical protein [Spirochaetaceae bacterium]